MRTASYGNYDSIRLDGGVDLPFGDIGGVRFAGFMISAMDMLAILPRAASVLSPPFQAVALMTTSLMVVACRCAVWSHPKASQSMWQPNMRTAALRHRFLLRLI